MAANVDNNGVVALVRREESQEYMWTKTRRTLDATRRAADTVAKTAPSFKRAANAVTKKVERLDVEKVDKMLDSMTSATDSVNKTATKCRTVGIPLLVTAVFGSLWLGTTYVRSFSGCNFRNGFDDNGDCKLLLGVSGTFLTMLGGSVYAVWKAM